MGELAAGVVDVAIRGGGIALEEALRGGGGAPEAVLRGGGGTLIAAFRGGGAAVESERPAAAVALCRFSRTIGTANAAVVNAMRETGSQRGTVLLASLTPKTG